MPLIERILFPVDFSSSCRGMAAYVKRAANIFHAEIVLLNVAEFNTYTSIELAVRSADDIAQDQIDASRQLLDGYLVEEFPLGSVVRLIRSGDPATEIVQAARDVHASLIIMPTHAGVFRSALLGSTAAKVLNDAACPVLTSRHAETIAPRPIDHREWLCAIGLATDSERVLRCASELSSQAHGHISIIHAIQMSKRDLRDLPLELDLQESIEAVARQNAHRAISQLKETVGVEAEIRISLGNVKDALLEAAREFDADVLMIGRGVDSGPVGRLRDLTYAVVRDSPFPVLSV